MNISRFCIQHKVTTLLAVIMISVFGVVFTTRLQMALLPDVEAPMAVVMCYYNGATPSDMEDMVTRPLETAILSVPGVEAVSSTSSDGVSQIQVTYVDDTNLDIAASKLREKFELLSLPDGAIDPIIVNMNLSDVLPTAIVALIGEDLAAAHLIEQGFLSEAVVNFIALREHLVPFLCQRQRFRFHHANLLPFIRSSYPVRSPRHSCLPAPRCSQAGR